MNNSGYGNNGLENLDPWLRCRGGDIIATMRFKNEEEFQSGVHGQGSPGGHQRGVNIGRVVGLSRPTEFCDH